MSRSEVTSSCGSQLCERAKGSSPSHRMARRQSSLALSSLCRRGSSCNPRCLPSRRTDPNRKAENIMLSWRDSKAEVLTLHWLDPKLIALWPTGHGVHSVLCVLDAKLPGAQGSHWSMPVSLLNEPAAQGRHADCSRNSTIEGNDSTARTARLARERVGKAFRAVAANGSALRRHRLASCSATNYCTYWAENRTRTIEADS
mgnify:CR=1 FL=1